MSHYIFSPLLPLFSCHKTVTAQCHIISSSPLLSLFSCHKTVIAQCHFISSPPLLSQFSCHKTVTSLYHISSPPLLSLFVTSNWHSVLITVHPSSHTKHTPLNTPLNIHNSVSNYLFAYSFEKMKPNGSQAVRKFRLSSEIWTIITSCTRARHFSLLWASSIQSLPPIPLPAEPP